VIAGDENSDPLDGESIPGAVQQLIDHPLDRRHGPDRGVNGPGSPGSNVGDHHSTT